MRAVLIVLVSLVFAIGWAAGQDESPTCPDSLPSQLVVGEQGRVTPGDANKLRAEPTTSAAETGQIPGGAESWVVP